MTTAEGAPGPRQQATGLRRHSLTPTLPPHCATVLRSLSPPRNSHCLPLAVHSPTAWAALDPPAWLASSCSRDWPPASTLSKRSSSPFPNTTHHVTCEETEAGGTKQLVQGFADSRQVFGVHTDSPAAEAMYLIYITLALLFTGDS